MSYTAGEAEAARRRDGAGTDWDMSHEEAVCRRHADPEAPRPYPGWEKAAPAHMPRPKDRLTLRVDADVVEWFKRQGQGYQTRMNAALRAFMDAHGHGS